MRKRDQQECCKEIEDGVHGGDSHRRNGIIQEIKADEYFSARKEKHCCSGADDVKGQMDDGYAFCGAVHTDAGKHRGDAGTDILPCDNGDCRSERYRSG